MNFETIIPLPVRSFAFGASQSPPDPVSTSPLAARFIRSHTGRPVNCERGGMLKYWPGDGVERVIRRALRRFLPFAASTHAAALIEAPTFSMISPIWFSLTMSGGISSIVSPDGRIMTPASKNE